MLAKAAPEHLLARWRAGRAELAGRLAALPDGAKLRQVAHLGVRTRDFPFAQHGRTAPAEPFRVELTAPDGGTWAWGRRTPRSG